MKKLGDTALKWSILVLVLRRVACWHCRHGIRFLHRSKMYLLSRAGSVPRAAGWLGVLKRFSISIFGVFRKRTISRTGRCQLEESDKREIVGRVVGASARAWPRPRYTYLSASLTVNTIAINETMFKSAIIASIVAGAAAFAPAQQGASSTALRADLSSEVCTSTQDTFYWRSRALNVVQPRRAALRLWLNNINCSHQLGGQNVLV